MLVNITCITFYFELTAQGIFDQVMQMRRIAKVPRFGS